MSTVSGGGSAPAGAGRAGPTAPPWHRHLPPQPLPGPAITRHQVPSRPAGQHARQRFLRPGRLHRWTAPVRLLPRPCRHGGAPYEQDGIGLILAVLSQLPGQ
jgi:hypothetical protein